MGAVFVGALIDLGASMIALQGRTYPENMFLNLGGMFAIVVASISASTASSENRLAPVACSANIAWSRYVDELFGTHNRNGR